MAEITRRRVGRPAHPFTPKQLNVRVHPKVADAAKKAAAERGLKENQYLSALIAKDTGDADLKDLAALLNQRALSEDSDDDGSALVDQEVLPFSA
jgi:ribosomal protein L4